MSITDREQFERLSDADLLVNSGVYQLFIAGSATKLDARGLPSLVLPQRSLTEQEATDALEVSAFARVGQPEHEIAAALYASEEGVSNHRTAGYFVGSYAGAVADDAVRSTSSSGGLTTWLLETLLREDRVDGVIHMTARQDGSNALFGYSISRTIEEIRSGSRTKYYPGDAGDQLLEILKADAGRYAIVGIPSFLYELRLASQRIPVLRERLRYFVGLVCGHQKSAAYADSLAWQVGVEPGKIRWMDFRKKLSERPASQYGVEIIGESAEGDEVHVVLPAADLYGTDWGLGFFKANYSDYTDDVFNETADVVLGDAWLPEYLSDSRGHNVLITRTREIDDMFQRGIERGEIGLDRLPIEAVVRSQAGLVRHGRELMATRRKFLAKRGQYLPESRFEQAGSRNVSRAQVQRLRVLMSRRSHGAFERAVSATDFTLFERQMRPLVRKYETAYKFARMVNSARRLLRR